MDNFEREVWILPFCWFQIHFQQCLAHILHSSSLSSVGNKRDKCRYGHILRLEIKKKRIVIYLVLCQSETRSDNLAHAQTKNARQYQSLKIWSWPTIKKLWAFIFNHSSQKSSFDSLIFDLVKNIFLHHTTRLLLENSDTGLATLHSPHHDLSNFRFNRLGSVEHRSYERDG